MPLLISPIDGSPMRQINRFGIELDVCPTSGGVWLDKGELEKIMAILKEESADDSRSDDSRSGRPPQSVSQNKDDYYDDDSRHERGGFKNKSKMSRLMDIFDF